MRRSTREFGFVGVVNVNGRFGVDGRCWEGPLSIGDVFQQVYQLVPEGPRHESGWDWSASDFRQIALRIEEIVFCGKPIETISSGYTARLWLSGEGQDLIRNDGHDVLGIERLDGV